MKQNGVRRVALALVLAAVPALVLASTATVEIFNKSDWDIHHFFLSPTDEEAWGPDQLGDYVLESGGSFELQGIPCDSYDIKLIDEDGDECIVPAVDVCRQDQGWVIDNDDLLSCEGYE